MSWLRYSDDFTEWPEWDRVSPAGRWAYIALVQSLSRAKAWDGVLPKRRVLAAISLHDDAAQERVDELQAVDLVRDHGQDVYVVRADDHLPSAGKRAETERAKIRMRRKRAHDADDHSLCLDGGPCPFGTVTRSVTRNDSRDVQQTVGTGRDGSHSSQVPMRDNELRATTATASTAEVAS